jgi:hypothetical protein
LSAAGNAIRIAIGFAALALVSFGNQQQFPPLARGVGVQNGISPFDAPSRRERRG